MCELRKVFDRMCLIDSRSNENATGTRSKVPDIEVVGIEVRDD